MRNIMSRNRNTEVFSDEDIMDLLDLLTRLQGYIVQDNDLTSLVKESKITSAQNLSRKCDSILDSRIENSSLEVN